MPGGHITRTAMVIKYCIFKIKICSDVVLLHSDVILLACFSSILYFVRHQKSPLVNDDAAVPGLWKRFKLVTRDGIWQLWSHQNKEATSLRDLETVNSMKVSNTLTMVHSIPSNAARCQGYYLLTLRGKDYGIKVSLYNIKAVMISSVQYIHSQQPVRKHEWTQNDGIVAERSLPYTRSY